ncbi:MAG: AAA family ATPase [Bacteroidales bacterium]|nr:AAA family ATPase [Bacteroidales bacterium]
MITGIRRSRKSFLLFELFAKHLKESGVKPDHIIQIDLED